MPTLLQRHTNQYGDIREPVPRGLVHLPGHSAAKLCRKFGIDYRRLMRRVNPPARVGDKYFPWSSDGVVIVIRDLLRMHREQAIAAGDTERENLLTRLTKTTRDQSLWLICADLLEERGDAKEAIRYREIAATIRPKKAKE